MDMQKAWEKALRNTEIIRTRIQGLMTFQETYVPYVLLSESEINVGDTVVRKGRIRVEKPSVILPPNLPQFQGFELEDEQTPQENDFVNFLLVRGVSLPSLKYNNTTVSLDIFEQALEKAVAHYKDELARTENVQTGLIVGPEDCWQFSLLIFICSQILRNTDTDIRRILERYKKRGEDS